MKGQRQQAAKGLRPAETQASKAQGALYQVYNFGAETQRWLLRLPPQHCVHTSTSKQEQGESQPLLDKGTWSRARLGGGTRGGRGADLLTLCSLRGQRDPSGSWWFCQGLCTRGHLYGSTCEQRYTKHLSQTCAVMGRCHLMPPQCTSRPI